MIKIYLLALATIFLSATAFSRTTGGDSDFDVSDDAEYIPVMVQVAQGEMDEMKSYLTERGVIILRERRDILLTYIPVDFDFSTIGNARSVRRFEPGKPRYNRPTMDVARTFNGADVINQGKGLPQPYDGTGVVVGVCDIGIDTRHPNFLTADGKECRIRRVVQYQEENGLRDVYSTPEEIYAWETDTDEEWHATHVTGIAAGAYSANGLQSLAPGADIVFTASMLSDVGLLAGVEDIIEYAREVGKPAVVNLSMGNTLGPHDGTSLFSQYLDYCADDAIICISAGNDGGSSSPKAMAFDFTDSNNDFCVRTTDWSGLHNQGYAEVWSADDTPFLFSLGLFNEIDNNQNIFFDAIDFSDGVTKSWRVSADQGDPDYNETFASLYNKGYISVEGGISPLNGRYTIFMQLDCYTDEYSPVSNDKWALYWPGVRIQADPGVHIDVFTGSTNFLRQAKGYPAPNNDMSISDLATGHRVISVGMTNNKDTETRLDGSVVANRFTAGMVCSDSSYGTLADGRVLPLTCAPGSYVLSSISGAYLRSHPSYFSNLNVEATVNGQKAYWKMNKGTSMACPYVAGAVATWLQANPKLTADEAVDIVRETNSHNYPEPDDPRHGQGWLDAYAGLEKVLDTASLSVEKTEPDGVATRYNDGILQINNLFNENLLVALYDCNGAKIKSSTIGKGYSEMSLLGLPTGIYILNLQTPEGLPKMSKLYIR